MFTEVQTYSFRNLTDTLVNTKASEVCLVGKNGQGKSNFLEAVYFLSYATSFRTTKDVEMIQNGHSSCSVIASTDTMELSSLRVCIQDNTKTIFHDDKRITDRKALLDIVPVILFSHEDMEIIHGPPEKRRWFFDQAASLGNPLYIDRLRSYKKILKTRNSVIKDRNTDLLDALDIQFVYAGLALMEERNRLLDGFSQSFGKLFGQISDIDGIQLVYRSSWKFDDFDKTLNLLKEKRENDYFMQTSTSGPHRDRWLFIQAGRDFVPRASTGQRRLLALLLRISQANWYTQNMGKKPIYLLDDVLLELDGDRKKRFFTLLPEYEQAFFTFLPEEHLLSVQSDSALIYTVEEGTLYA